MKLECTAIFELLLFLCQVARVGGEILGYKGQLATVVHDNTVS